MPGSQLVLTVVQAGEQSVLRLTGTLDLATVDGFVGEAMRVLAETGNTLALDMAGVDFCDSTGLSGLIKLRTKARADGVEIRIDNPPRHLRQLLAITGLAGAFGVPDHHDDEP